MSTSNRKFSPPQAASRHLDDTRHSMTHRNAAEDVDGIQQESGSGTDEKRLLTHLSIGRPLEDAPRNVGTRSTQQSAPVMQETAKKRKASPTAQERQVKRRNKYKPFIPSDGSWSDHLDLELDE